MTDEVMHLSPNCTILDLIRNHTNAAKMKTTQLLWTLCISSHFLQQGRKETSQLYLNGFVK